MRRLSRIFQLKIRCVYARLRKLNAIVFFYTSQISITIGPLNEDDHYSAINFNNRQLIGLTSEWKVESALKWSDKVLLSTYWKYHINDCNQVNVVYKNVKAP
jgi:hypothetical protein